MRQVSVLSDGCLYYETEDKIVKNCSHSTFFTVIVIWNRLFTLDVCTLKSNQSLQPSQEGCRHQGGFGGFSLPRLRLLYIYTTLVGVVTKTCSILSSPHFLKCVYIPA